jgi:ATP-dependent RNA helicase DBP3
VSGSYFLPHVNCTNLLHRLINVLNAANQPVPEDLLKFGTTVKKKEHAAYGAFYKDVDMTKKATKITFD